MRKGAERGYRDREKLDKSDKSSNTLQVGQIKHCNQFPWGLLYLCMYVCICFLLSMRLAMS